MARHHKPRYNHAGFGEYVDFDRLTEIYSAHLIPQTPPHLAILSEREVGEVCLDAEDVCAVAHQLDRKNNIDTQRRIWLLADQALRQELAP